MFDLKTILTGTPTWTRQEEQPPAYEYSNFPRRFVSYRWFKPLLTAALTMVFWLVFAIVLSFAISELSGDPNILSRVTGNGYDGMDTYSPIGGLLNFGILAIVLPAMALALLITRERPFSSLSSSCGGWRWNVFWKCLGVAAVLYSIQIPIQMFLLPDSEIPGVILFDVVGFFVCIFLVPLQCAAEEYMFRGFLMQTFGSWFKFPIIALILQSFLFMMGHPYNALGMTAIFANGLAFGIVALVSRGLESGCAYHIVNNMTAFLMVGFGLGITTSEITVGETVISIAMDIVYIAIMLVADRRWHWFEPKKDGTIAFNENKLAKMASNKVEAAIERGAVLPPSYIEWQRQNQFPYRSQTPAMHE